MSKRTDISRRPQTARPRRSLAIQPPIDPRSNAAQPIATIRLFGAGLSVGTDPARRIAGHHVPLQTTERYLDCRHRFRDARPAVQNSAPEEQPRLFNDSIQLIGQSEAFRLVLINALLSINGVVPGLSATRKLSRNGIRDHQSPN